MLRPYSWRSHIAPKKESIVIPGVSTKHSDKKFSVYSINCRPNASPLHPTGRPKKPETPETGFLSSTFATSPRNRVSLDYLCHQPSRGEWPFAPTEKPGFLPRFLATPREDPRNQFLEETRFLWFLRLK